uniref:Serpentine receptor class gamma n=1 Tax=Caenorhabditis tropicalis TaxID=1561998 RepID=A0A1I7T3Z2_9PELO
MQQDTSLFWILFFIFHVILCIFGLFSQNIFMKTAAFDRKLPFTARVHLFFLSIGYQIILITFLAMTTVCLHYGSMFEVDECKEARMIPLKFHNFGEFTAVIFHFLINLGEIQDSLVEKYIVNETFQIDLY